MSDDQTDDLVLKYGTGGYMIEATREQAERYCKQKTEETGRLHDWRYVGGRVVVLAIPEAVSELIKERDALRVDLAEIAKLIHYPDCWCDTAYPTLLDAINQITDFKCATCEIAKRKKKEEATSPP